MSYLIWSYEHNSWWASGRSGYTCDLGQAGRYSAEEAGNIVTDSVMMDELVVPEFWAERYGEPKFHPYQENGYEHW